jgi:predicted Fe-Mo cluster-binding NifX family protein
MKYAIACTNDDRSAGLSEHFARCGFYAIWDPSTGETRFAANPFPITTEHLGIKVLDFLAQQGVKRIIATSFGTMVQNKAQELNIQLIVFDHGGNTLAEVLDLLGNSTKAPPEN